jgi:uncharacterized membrane protein (GlpM family)
MTTIFITQLIVSFIVGGSFIALLTFLAERSNSRISGIIISFPSTALLGFFFLAWTQSPEEVATLVPATLIPLGISILFAVFYAYLAQMGAKFIHHRLILITITLLLSVLSWLLLSLPLAMFKMTNLLYGILGYLAFVVIGHVLLKRKKQVILPKHSYTIWQIIIRASFVGLLIVLVVLLGETVNPFWGGVLSMFPAALSSSLIVIHWYFGHNVLFSVVRRVPLGSISIFVYAIIVMLSFPWVGFIYGTLLAFLGSLTTSYLLSKIKQ